MEIHLGHIHKIFVALTITLVINTFACTDMICENISEISLSATLSENNAYSYSFSTDWTSKYLWNHLSIYRPVMIETTQESDTYRISMNALPYIPLGLVDITMAILSSDDTRTALRKFPMLTLVYYTIEGIPNSDVRYQIYRNGNNDIGVYIGNRLQIYPYSKESLISEKLRSGIFLKYNAIDISFGVVRKYYKKQGIGFSIAIAQEFQ